MDMDESSKDTIDDGRDDELYVPHTSETDTSGISRDSHMSNESQLSLQQHRDSAERTTNQTVTRTGRIVKPSS